MDVQTEQTVQTEQGPKLSKETLLAEIGVEGLRPRQDPFLAELEAKYAAECDKARRRAERFGVEYKEPDKAQLFAAETKRAQRMRPDEGFYVSMDLQSQEEKAKQAARGQRWGNSEAYAKSLEDAEEVTKKAERAARFGLPVQEAVGGVLRKMGLNPKFLYVADPARHDPGRKVQPNAVKALTDKGGEGGEREEGNGGMATVWEPVEPPPEEVEASKVHVHALDREEFQAIRSGDVLRYFTDFFPRCELREGGREGGREGWWARVGGVQQADRADVVTRSAKGVM